MSSKTKQPQTFSEAFDRALRYQQYKSIALLIISGVLYLAAKQQEKVAAR